MTLPVRAVSLLAIPAVLALGGVAFVGACGSPLPTAPVEESSPPAIEAPTASTAQPTARGEGSFEPEFTPMTVRPMLTNAAEVRQALIREYPVLLRDAGVEGAPVLWIHIDESGAVDATRIHESSGFEALDQAAMNVAQAMVFAPARNDDAVVAVWVQVPIRFAVGR